MNAPANRILQSGILATAWRRHPVNGSWLMDGMESLMFPAPGGAGAAKFHALRNAEISRPLLTQGTYHEVQSTFGTVESLIKRRILPVVAWVNGDLSMKCIGTAFVISCSGYVVTACHVLLDPLDSGYGNVRVSGTAIHYADNVNIGVLIATFDGGFRFFGFGACSYWGTWRNSPLFHERPRLAMSTDIAVCKIDEAPNGVAHQPLNLSPRPYRVGDRAMAIGYAEMEDIPISTDCNGNVTAAPFANDLYVSTGDVVEVLDDNHLDPRAQTPGPCFHFGASIPGRMSGSPIFDLELGVVRGVVSTGLSGAGPLDERHATGAMIGPAMQLALIDGRSVQQMIASGVEGMVHALNA
jgi:S1-C subfamily serine protease